MIPLIQSPISAFSLQSLCNHLDEVPVVTMHLSACQNSLLNHQPVDALSLCFVLFFFYFCGCLKTIMIVDIYY